MAELPHVGVLGDTYHMAEAVKRRFPKPGDGQDYAAHWKALKEAG
ncbi:hypothetical protein [Acutalibacter sp. 1XD8-33]|nr:hypothetical protein [Acutalibacter sp. 1XD8-33]